MRNRESRNYSDKINEILSECQQSVDEAYLQYEEEIEEALEEFHKRIKKSQTWVH